MRDRVRLLTNAVAGITMVMAGGAGAMAAENLSGFWMDADGEVIIEWGTCGDSQCGKVAWLKKPLGPDGLPLRDYRNSDSKLQSRPVCGLEVVSGFKKQPDGTWGGGTVYVSDMGSSYSGYAEVLDATRVKVTGYVLLPIFGESEVWTRVAGPKERCSANAPKAAEPQWTTKTAPSAAPAPIAAPKTGAVKAEQ